MLWLDRETWSEVDLKLVGTALYAETAEDLLLAYAIDDGPEVVWDCTAEEMHDELYYALEDEEQLVTAHNAYFDRTIHNGPAQQRLPRVRLERWRCSMAQALSHALPGGLSELCQVLDVPESQAKLKEGDKLLRLFTRPQPANRKIRRPTRHTHPAEWERFKAYAARDIGSMRECVRRMPRWNWNASAIAEWHCDQRINERGIFIDRELARAGVHAAVSEKARIGQRFREITGGLNPGQRDKVKDFVLERYHVALDNTTKDTFTQLLKDKSHDPEFRELMELSMQANKTSTAKYAKLEPMIQDDGRFRGALQFAGASRTRRWAGRGPQYHNLPSRGLPPAELVDLYIETLKGQSHDLFFQDSEMMWYGSAALRGTVIASPGKKLEVADLSNIEGRMLAWVADEAWKLEAFRAYDAGTGPDLYNITAVSIIGGDPWKVPKVDRNVFGKVPDLASGYQGGVSGYQTFAKAYGVRMADHWNTIQRQISQHLVEKAHENLHTWGRPQVAELEISETEWLASETCKLAWRARHPATTKFWYALGDAAKQAIQRPGFLFTAGKYIRVKCVIFKDQKWLVVSLPSGRYLTYFNPKLIRTDPKREGLAAFSITYEGEASEDGKTSRHWTRVFTHGGKMTGNVCQALARDVLTPALMTAEVRGYLPVLSVHDEAIAEVQNDDRYSARGLIDILATNPQWAVGLPLAAAGFEAYRYKKD